MRKQKVALYIGVAVSVFVFALVKPWAQEDIVALEDRTFKNRQRPAAVFRHDAHNAKAEIEGCSICHHAYQDGEKVEDDASDGQSCSGCHDVEEGEQAEPLMRAYHDLCKSCHRKNREGPVACGECHRRI
jgi:predicted CXXCH cytochrome family protein